MRSSMKTARSVAVAAVLVATAVGGLAPVVGADPADYPVTLFPSGVEPFTRLLTPCFNTAPGVLGATAALIGHDPVRDT